MNDRPLPLGLTTAELQALSKALKRGVLVGALDAEGLAGVGLSHLTPRLGPLAGMDVASAGRLTDVVLAERNRTDIPRVEVVWTGPEAATGWARDTAVVVRQLFGGAKRSVLVAGYSFDSGYEIFAPLRPALERGVDVSLFLNLPPAPSEDGVRRHIDVSVGAFLRRNWESAHLPTIYIDPRTAEPQSAASLHAKCIVVDERHTLVTSANFTNRGHNRNIELGVLVDHERLARDVIEQWMSAVSVGIFRRV